MTEIIGSRTVIRGKDGIPVDIIDQKFGRLKRSAWTKGEVLAEFTRERITRALLDGFTVEIEGITKI